jgi:hypothetical protein
MQITIKYDNFATYSLNKEALAIMANNIKTSIISRVQRYGDGVSAKMPKYSKSYERLRERTRRNVEFRVLTFTGRMMQSMSVKNKKNASVIYFLGVAEAKKAVYNQKLAPWFGVSRSDEVSLEKNLSRLINGL